MQLKRVSSYYSGKLRLPERAPASLQAKEKQSQRPPPRHDDRIRRRTEAVPATGRKIRQVQIVISLFRRGRIAQRPAGERVMSCPRRPALKRISRRRPTQWYHRQILWTRRASTWNSRPGAARERPVSPAPILKDTAFLHARLT